MIVRRKKAAEAVKEQAREQWWRAGAVRHRSAGHLRFDLPPALVAPPAAAALEAGLRQVEGVYRVAVYPGFKKLSVRWSPAVCGEAEVVRALSTAIAAIADGLEAAPQALADALPVPAKKPGLIDRIKQAGPVARLRERYETLRVRVDAVNNLIALKTGRASPLPFDPKDWAIHFVNDLVAFYLIRVHWDRITHQWLPKPWAHRYQWLAVVYLTFLLVRHRKSTAPKVTKK
jgi:hypothetical protein